MAIVEINKSDQRLRSRFLPQAQSARARWSFTVNRRGQIFGFLGANGAGKTTTLKLLMRLIFPTNGSAHILGHDIQDVSMHQRIGYLPENPYFYDYLTAREFLDYCARDLRLPAAERKKRAADLLARVNLDEKRWDTQLRKFSKGMLQRVGLAQSLINDPEIVFLDEPMSGLDPVGRREVRDLIAALRDEGKTVFMCSHILSDIEVLCDRVAILKRGRLAQVGYLDELRRTTEGPNRMEVMATGTDAELVEATPSRSRIAPTPRGLRIEIASEDEIDECACALRKAEESCFSSAGQAVAGRTFSIDPNHWSYVI